MKNSLLRLPSLLLGFVLLLSAPALWSCSTETSFARTLREHQEKYKVIDDDTIQSYLRRNNYLSRSEATGTGLHLVTIENGQGRQVTAGKQVRVKYIGRFLNNSYSNTLFAPGSIFDNSTENRTVCGCAVFTAGSGTVAGFSEGLLRMRERDRKLLLIPSRLGYGPNGQLNSNNSGYIIPPDATLLFDVEILSVSE
ncbi:FKBP-type peptidyl-prolyl cis-trans isomerase [Hymenobacter saemangeumensis]